LNRLSNAVIQLDDTVLDEEAVRILLAVIPARLSISFGSGSPLLEHAEHLVAKLKEIPCIEDRLVYMETKLSFTRKILKIREDLEVVENAIRELRLSQGLRALFELILAIGNFVNSACLNRFKVADLLKMEALPCNHIIFGTFLHYISSLLETNPGTIDRLCVELAHLPRACRVDLTLIHSRLDCLGKQLHKVSCELLANNCYSKMNMQMLLDTHKNELLEVRRLDSIVQNSFQELVDYFGEKEQTSNEIFIIINAFLDNLQRANEENQLRKYMKVIRPKIEFVPPLESKINTVHCEKLFNKTLLLLYNGAIFKR